MTVNEGPTRRARQPAGADAILALVSVIWGTAWIPNQILSEEASPLRSGALVFGIAASACGLWVLLRMLLRAAGWRRNFSVGPTIQSQLGPGALLSVTMFAAPYLLLLWAARQGASAWIPLCYAVLPLALGLVAGKLQTPAILAIGAMLVLLNGSIPLSVQKLAGTLPIWLAVGLQGFSLIFVRRSLARNTSTQSLGIQMGGASLILFGAEWLRSGLAGDAAVLSRGAIVSAVSLGVVANAGAYLLFYRVLQSREPDQIAVTQWLQPLIAVAESAWLLRRTPSWPMLGATGVLLGCAWQLLRIHPPDAPSLLASRED